MAPKNYLAFDLGAESGRAVLGTLDGGRISPARDPSLSQRAHDGPGTPALERLRAP